jgi:hypothetical protein
MTTLLRALADVSRDRTTHCGGNRTGPAPAPPATPLAPDAKFTIACATATLEAAPIYVTAEGPFGPRMQYINGGVRSLANNARTRRPMPRRRCWSCCETTRRVRLLFTLAEGMYQIVAKKSAGITKLADLKGKRVVVPRSTSAHYYLVAMLRSAGLNESDVTLVTAPADMMAAAVVRGDADPSRCGSPSRRTPSGRSDLTPSSFRTTRSIASSSASIRPRRAVGSATASRARGLRPRARVSTDRLRQDPAPYLPLIRKVTNHPEDQVAPELEASRISVRRAVGPA